MKYETYTVDSNGSVNNQSESNDINVALRSWMENINAVIPGGKSVMVELDNPEIDRLEWIDSPDCVGVSASGEFELPDSMGEDYPNGIPSARVVEYYRM